MNPTNLDPLAVKRRIEAGETALVLTLQELIFLSPNGNQSIPLAIISQILHGSQVLNVFSGSDIVLTVNLENFEAEDLQRYFDDVHTLLQDLLHARTAESTAQEWHQHQVQIRCTEAQAADISPQRLETLAEDPSNDVRIVVASHAQAPTWVLHNLARDEDERVRAAVAQNPATPAHLLEHLVHDQAAVVQSAAQEALLLALEALGNSSEIASRQIAAQHAQTPSALLLQLSQDPVPEIQQLAYSNPNHPAFSSQNAIAFDPTLMTAPSTPAAVPIDLPGDFLMDNAPSSTTLNLADTTVPMAASMLRARFERSPDGRALWATLHLSSRAEDFIAVRVSAHGEHGDIAELVYPKNETIELAPGGTALLVFLPPSDLRQAWHLTVEQLRYELVCSAELL